MNFDHKKFIEKIVTSEWWTGELEPEPIRYVIELEDDKWVLYSEVKITKTIFRGQIARNYIKECESYEEAILISKLLEAKEKLA